MSDDFTASPFVLAAITCPANSHYEPCAAACPATCVNPMAPYNCSLPCVEGCACDSGYLLYNNQCVPSQQCGCWHNGQHYPVGSEFWTDNTCSSKCTCPTRGGKVQCSSASCPAGQFCGVQNGKPECLEHSYGICHVHGDPHYNTFDKVTHDFMGNCTYTLAKVCSNTSVPYFNVEAKNEHRGNPQVSYVREVVVDVYGERITILKQERSRVLVNGEYRTLPVSAAGGAISVSSSGRYVVLETDFRLQVSYDADHSVEVKVPTSYFNLTCGMCGNFNNWREDDYMMPNGQQAADSNALGESWQVPSSDSEPSCGVPPPTGPCPEDEEKLYESEQFCGMLTARPGFFESCHAVINPQSYFETCSYDLCAMSGVQEVLCGALEAYADACQAAGVTLLPWRNATFCPLPCSANSYYDPCMTGCPATCVDRQAPQNCSKPCMEGCACASGFLLSGDTCVPEARCGCLFEGNYYSEGESIVSENCSRQCRCEASGQMVCSALSCGEEEVCKIQNGQRGCFPASTALCHIYGDPHYSTFDGKLHHFQGSCNYTVVTACDNSSLGFSITIRNEHRGNPSWTALNSINGVLAILPASPTPHVNVSLSGSYVQVSTKLGLQLQFDGDQDLLVRVSEKHKGKLCGLCGTYTGSKEDDFRRPDGVVVPDFNDFGASWMVPDDEGRAEVCCVWPKGGGLLRAEGNGDCGPCAGGPFEPCHTVLPPQAYFESCVYDQCGTSGSTEQLCSDLSSYAAACAAAGVALGDWSAGTVCGEDSVWFLFKSYHYLLRFYCTNGHSASLFFGSGIAITFFPCCPAQCLLKEIETILSLFPGHASCSASGDPHYNTFDHRVHNFMGNCSYTLSKVCNVSQNIPYFDVSTTNEHRGSNTKVSYVKSVQVEVYGYQISMLKSKKVNVRKYLFKILISIQNSGGYVLLETDFGLWVRYDGNHYAEVSMMMVINSPFLFCPVYTGIFKDCHNKVPPENFFNNCVYDMCFTEGEATSLCYGLQAYAESCINAGICIEWRNATLCPMSCPGGSIYKGCGTRCPSTCVSSSAANTCSSLPVEGCFCKDGYVLSGDTCVPESNCGCVDDKNHYHELGESWFTSSSCTERCTCNAGNVTDCSPWECGVREECSVKDGVLGCHSNGQVTCQVAGDPHYFTFDGLMYTFVGTCTYTLVKSVSYNVNSITILGKNEDRGLRGATYLKEVYIDVYGTRITLRKSKEILVGVGAIYSILVCLQVQGMCGNFNDDYKDDLSLPNGTLVSVTQFGNSWKVEEDIVSVLSCSCLSDSREDDVPPCTDEYKPIIESQCNVLKSDKFKACHDLVKPEDFIKICTYDMCRYDGMKSALCDIVQFYVDTCRNQGITITWRNSTFCPLPCPSHSHYTACASACPSTCNDIFASSLCEKTESCTEGCECDNNYVLSNGKCVPLSDCGCRDDDNNYYSVSSSL
uniref:VWFD domain-containing protein n=1 Tax=Pavo cristatus TaxID=9049 RepID=A0A8C9ESW0_PAVCR